MSVCSWLGVHVVYVFFLLENVSVLWHSAKARISIARLRSFVEFCGEILTPEMPREMFGGWQILF